MTHLEVMEIINAWDPINLLALHAPKDEYIDEAKKISKFCLNNISENTLAEKIYEIFINNFGEDIFNKSLDECKDIANAILLKDFTL